MNLKKNKFFWNQETQIDQTLYLIGRKAVQETLEHEFLKSQIKQIILATTQKHLIEYCQKHQLTYLIKPKKWFEQKFAQLNHQYVAIALKSVNQLDLKTAIVKYEKQDQVCFLMLDQIQDPHNFGAIIRTAVAAGIDGIIIADKNQVSLTPTVLKVSVGSGLLIDIIKVKNLQYALNDLAQAGYWSYAAVLNEQAQAYNQIEYAKKSVLIMGNEGNGIAPILIKKSDFQIYIPMSKKTDSLNVSVATGILVFNILKNKW